MEACEAKEMEQMERLQFTDFMLFFTNLIMSRDSVHKLCTEILLMCAYLRVCVMVRPRRKPTTKVINMLAS